MPLKPIDISHVSIASIHVDADYQRPLDEKRIQRILDAFESGATKALSLSRRPCGRLFAYDGQHTLEAYRLLGYQKVPATIVAGDKQQEAKWFLQLNGKGVKKATQREKHKAGCVAGDNLSLASNDLLAEFGIEIAKGGTGKGKTSCLAEIKSLILKDDGRLIRAMGLIKRLWSEEEKAWTQVLIRGAFLVCDTEENTKIMEKALKKHKVTPTRIIDTAIALQHATGIPGGGVGYAKTAYMQLSKLKD